MHWDLARATKKGDSSDSIPDKLCELLLLLLLLDGWHADGKTFVSAAGGPKLIRRRQRREKRRRRSICLNEKGL